MSRRASPDSFDGVPYGDLPIEEIDWSQAIARGHDPGQRSQRSGGDDVPVEHATHAAFDSRALVYDSGSTSGETVEVIGYSSAADKVLRVILRPKSDARPGTWWGETAWVAGPRYRKLYERGIDDD